MCRETKNEDRGGGQCAFPVFCLLTCMRSDVDGAMGEERIAQSGVAPLDSYKSFDSQIEPVRYMTSPVRRFFKNSSPSESFP